MTKKYIYKNQGSLWGESECVGFGTYEFYVQEIDRKLANDIIIKNHYSKKVVSVPHQKLDLGIFYKNKLIELELHQKKLLKMQLLQVQMNKLLF